MKLRGIDIASDYIRVERERVRRGYVPWPDNRVHFGLVIETQ